MLGFHGVEDRMNKWNEKKHARWCWIQFCQIII
jgi:hypothetical protein